MARAVRFIEGGREARAVKLTRCQHHEASRSGPGIPLHYTSDPILGGLNTFNRAAAKSITFIVYIYIYVHLSTYDTYHRHYKYIYIGM